ncbi:MAG: PhzF family phenazine biosynthesis protein [Actinomycetota bacterium]
MTRPFRNIDVFGAGPVAGNPLAVVHDAQGLSTDQMQRLTRWLNLSETTFLLPPSDPAADYRVRIFTLARELPFAGHPTLGTCHAWLEAGGRPKRQDVIVQQCGAGNVPLRRIDGRLAFRAPELLRSGPLTDEELTELTTAVGIDPADVIDGAWVDNGPGWAALLLSSAEQVLAVEAPTSHATQLDMGVVGFHPEGAEPDLEVRAFFSDADGRVIEDPVTGSLNASVAQWLIGSGRVGAPYVAGQGRKVGADGRVHLSLDEDGAIWVAGETTTLVEGTLHL